MSTNGTVESTYKPEPLFTKEQIGNMVLAEVQANLKDQYEKAEAIERRYDGLITDAEDEHQVKRHLLTVDALVEYEGRLRDALDRKQRVSSGLDLYSRPQNNHVQPNNQAPQLLSPGDQFVRSAEWNQLRKSGRFESSLHRNEFAVMLANGTSLISWQRALEQKTIINSGSGSAGAMVFPDIQPGVVSILQREINVLDLIPRLGTDSNVVEWVRETAFTNAAAPTPEATVSTGTTGTKPESALTYQAMTTNVHTMAHWIPVTNNALNDAPQIRGIINSRLLLGLTLTLETQIVSGDGTGENFTGILNAGIGNQPLGTDSTLDAVFKARTMVRVVGHARPNAIVMHPYNWQTARLSRENVASATLGGYMMGPPSMTGANTAWGLPVVESEAIPQGTALVGDFAMGCTLFDREQSNIRVGLVNDNFIRNMQTILAELRAAFIVWRPTAFARVTGVT
jgi:HK97 family phage major capsid protein